MTRQNSARIAGFTYLFYIAVAFPSMVLFTKATAGANTAARLATVVQHTTELRVSLILNLLSAFCALTLAVTLYGITREEDHEIAMFGLVCRVAEGVLAGILSATSGLLWLATIQGPDALDTQSANAIGALLLNGGGWQSTVAATFFAAGSTAFCWLLWRGRMVPSPLAMLGVVASALILVGLPLQLAAVLPGTIAQLMWIPIALFEITVAMWFLVKGVR
ncbi:MAG: DUF4386 domain-containing protein [Gemmatimonadaceae bacterium]